MIVFVCQIFVNEIVINILLLRFFFNVYIPQYIYRLKLTVVTNWVMLLYCAIADMQNHQICWENLKEVVKKF